MTVQTLKISGREFVLVPKRDFDRLTKKARRQSEDEYWTRSALKTEAASQARGEKPVPFEQVERELDEIAARRRAAKSRRHRGRR